MTTTRRWVAGAVAAALLLVVATWFLLISPQRSQAAELGDQVTAQQDANETIRLRTQQLKAQFASLPQRQAELAEIRQQLPGTPDLPALVRQLSTVAADAGVSVDSVAPGQPQPLAGAAAAGAGTGTSSTGTASGTAGLQAIALTTVVKGGYADLTLFLQKLQGSMPRAYLVENLSLTPGEAASDAATSGTLTMTVTGKVFVLTPATASTGVAQGSTTTATTTPAN